MNLTKEIQETICKAEIHKGNHVAENFNYFFRGELDVISLAKSGYVSEFEVKVSRSDFRADAKKSKWQYINWCLESKSELSSRYLPNYFTYVCPLINGKGIILESDLKPYMGLIYFQDGELITVRKSKIIHKNKHNILNLLTKMLRVNNWRHYFCAQKLTILNRQAIAYNDECLKEKVNNSIKNLPKK